ncbi:MAG: hypothetical protein UT39_C0013G0001, partial [Candidatus Woesebacteria bacterium GW2011_GWA1_39_21]
KYTASLGFDGTNDNVSVTSDGLDDISPATYSFWFYPKSGGDDYGGIISKGTSFTIDKQDSTNSLEFYHQCFGNSMYALTPDNSIQLNTWQHVSATWDGTCNLSGVKIYLNGVSQALSGASATNPPTSDAADNLHIGVNDVASSYFTGMIDDVRIYNYALTPTQVKLLYNNSSAVQFGQ